MSSPTVTSTRGPVDPTAFPEKRTGGRVLVTGMTGLVGAHVGLALARAGYEVHATSRSQARADAFNKKWPTAQITWSIIPDQTTPGVYDEAAKGCIGIFHVAGPFNYFHEVCNGK